MTMIWLTWAILIDGLEDIIKCDHQFKTNAFLLDSDFFAQYKAGWMNTQITRVIKTIFDSNNPKEGNQESK